MSPHLLVLSLAPVVQLQAPLPPVPDLSVTCEGVVAAEDNAAAHELVQHQVGVPNLDLDSFCRPVSDSFVRQLAFIRHSRRVKNLTCTGGLRNSTQGSDYSSLAHF